MKIHLLLARTTGAALVGLAGAASIVLAGSSAGAAIVPTVPLATAGSYAVLGGSKVTNTGGSVLDGSLGLWPGTSITGFPPGIVLPPGTIDTTNAVAQQAQSDLTVGYNSAAGRSIDGTTTADLANLTLQAGVYAGPSKGALLLSGPLVLDGAGNASSVFIFQTDSTLTTATASTVTLIGGALECNVFWQIGSSATLGTSSVFRGNLLALTAITVNNGVTVHGRALARNAAVTLDNDVFVKPTCAAAPPATTTSTPGATTTTADGGGTTTTTGAVGATTSTTSAAATTTTTSPAATTTTTEAVRAASVTTTTLLIAEATTTTAPADVSVTASAAAAPAVPAVVAVPRTGGTPAPEHGVTWPMGVAAGLVGSFLLLVGRRPTGR
jgi:hypothetical protein